MALPEEVLAAHGQVHLLVNNAGVSVAGRFEEVATKFAVLGFSEALRAELLGSPVGFTGPTGANRART